MSQVIFFIIFAWVSAAY